MKRINESKQLWNKIEKSAAKHPESVLNKRGQTNLTDEAAQESTKKLASKMPNGDTPNRAIPTRYSQ